MCQLRTLKGFHTLTIDHQNLCGTPLGFMRSCFVFPGVRRIHGDPRLCCETPVGVVHRTLAGRSSLCHMLDKMLHSVALQAKITVFSMFRWLAASASAMPGFQPFRSSLIQRVFLWRGRFTICGQYLMQNCPARFLKPEETCTYRRSA